VSYLTEPLPKRCSNGCVGGERIPDNHEDNSMFLAIIVTIIITAGIVHALNGGGRGGAILRRPYNNRYNAASGAREDAHV
jgi:hypothetical protein